MITTPALPARLSPGLLRWCITTGTRHLPAKSTSSSTQGSSASAAPATAPGAGAASSCSESLFKYNPMPSSPSEASSCTALRGS
eukprot:366385-Chlamydomonas_euryale.AAC.4